MIIQGDCIEEMKKFPDNHFNAIITDPPYGLSFMGKEWDNEVPGIQCWKECLRITKPGGYLLAMGGSRTSHRTATAIEASGYEIRDTIMWIYGSGFPKSHNHFGIQGYGTALKPAYEPIIMAMKPIDGTFKKNAEKWGQAGINIDGSRIGEFSNNTLSGLDRYNQKYVQDGSIRQRVEGTFSGKKGRWPANVIFDEEAGTLLDKQSDTEASAFFYCAKASRSERNEGLEGMPKVEKPLMGEFKNNPGRETPKSSSAPRQNHHPTVKPLKLMEYLIKLVMPPQFGILLDPFAGSGTTILAAKRLGFESIGIEKVPEYCDIAKKRLENFHEI